MLDGQLHIELMKLQQWALKTDHSLLKNWQAKEQILDMCWRWGTRDVKMMNMVSWCDEIMCGDGVIPSQAHRNTAWLYIRRLKFTMTVTVKYSHPALGGRGTLSTVRKMCFH